MATEKAQKKAKLRHAEYYDFQSIQDKLYADSSKGKIFKHLTEIIALPENIRLAYRNIKKNSGSMTPGTDGKIIADLAKLSDEQLITAVQRKLQWYVPQSVRRVEIPKGNDPSKKRPLGIPTIMDRLIQQCVLQVMEPICEAKFHDHSYGFRPNRNQQHAIAQVHKNMQQSHLHYVVDIDIKGFFDNVNHGKLLKQLWTLGIRDKKLLSIISAMLKAEVAGIGFPKAGTPQGGIISPLLSNVVLNELDWWLASQWEEMPTNYPYKPQINSNGSLNKGHKYEALRRSRLKEITCVRYADDFKIFTNSYQSAVKLFYAAKNWLHDRLSLEISPEKSKVINLKEQYSEFLGFKLKVIPRGKRSDGTPKYVVESHIREKSIAKIKPNLKRLIFHCSIQIIKRSVGRSAVAAAAYRSGEKLTNEWDGLTHDYTHKGGIVHTEIMLPAHAPPEFADRETLWNSMEQIEKSSNAQLARDIEIALPVELSPAEQLNLVRTFVKDNFVDAGMCADFAIHDKGDSNPHAHIMLTIRPLREDGKWGAKCRKVYDLDGHGDRIPDGKGGWKNHREDTTDWNHRDNAEKWRTAWAAYANRALEAAGRLERIDHRSYKRQGVEIIPSIHMGPAASQMERRGIQTEKGTINRQIAADNKLLKEIKARITRLYNWSKEQAEAEPPRSGGSVLAQLYEAQAKANSSRAKTQNGKIKALQANAKLLAFLQGNGITSMQKLYEKISLMNQDYYGLRGRIVSTERRLAVLNERLEMWTQYQKYKPIRQKLDKLKPRKREQYQQEHRAELASFDTAASFLKDLKASGEAITPKAWKAEAAKLTAQKEMDYLKMRSMREEIKAVESLRKTADRLAREGQYRQEEHDR